MAMASNLSAGQRAQRKTLITVAAWGPVTSGTEEHRVILGTRTEDSSIEFNADIATTTDILGINYTDVNKTQPQQTFDPFYIMGGSTGQGVLVDYLKAAALENDINKYNNVFTIYIIDSTMSETVSEATSYKAYKHEGCSIIPTSIGGSDYLNMPIEVHYSNNITTGKVDKIAEDFAFTADS